MMRAQEDNAGDDWLCIRRGHYRISVINQLGERLERRPVIGLVELAPLLMS
jgi:hypothetical protein